MRISDALRPDRSRADDGFVLPLLLAIVIGIFLAGLTGVALVNAGSTSGTAPIQAPLVTYDAP